jgi:hypothetical protein
MRVFTILLAIVLLVTHATAQEKKGKGLSLNSLPPAVRATVQANLKGAEIRNISKEKEDGVEQYEVETVLQGKARGFDVDSRGVLLVIEEATSLDAIPAAARAGILRKVAAGRVTRVETFNKPGQPLMYEVGYTTAAGRKHEVLVKADGTESKE